ncbi:zinc/manganese transport system substrate-binding protein [Kitasatospora sp. MAP12-15]|uniref:metal ABC transporter solute-binding protein, Zn/Mn family n=1 Tax=unclassified Kitasatospora TaxID=2633591 RepID=UPI0024757EE3|nr:zinc ABC transporter substrate-binding protein [Kitasatospora sp. MAP12-44]MDH6108589.1 zinc/manganese transport system substrate-binding protein [Kitasatospora sp. MAP12-44]
MRTVLPAAVRRHPARLALTAAAVVALAATSACSTSSTPKTSASGASGSKTIQVVAAENFWGSIATQLGGSHVKVSSIITNPDTDPHSYEPTAADGRTIAGADFAITNGIGYDAWSDKLLAANPNSARTALKVGDLVGKKEGDNPHQWYSHASVYKVIDQITADYQKIDPADAAYFDTQKQTFENQTLAQYNQLETDIKTKYAGTPIGASESIVTPLAESVGLKMLTPETFLDAESEGTDPTAADKTLIDQQIATKAIKIYVFNTQNSDPDVVAQVNAAKAQGIPVAQVTETLAPASSTFQDWQVKELQGIEDALKAATGK